MKNLLFVSLLSFAVLPAFAQVDDSTALKGVAMDYAEGWYNGDAVRMERAIHPDLNKAIPERLAPSAGITFRYSSYSMLVEGSRAKLGLVEQGKRKLTVSIVNINGDLANVRVNSAMFNDYLQMVKIDNQWKIVNVLYTVGLDSKDRLQNFEPVREFDAIKESARNYIEAAFSGDAKLLERVLYSDFNRLSYGPLPTGKLIFRRIWSNTLIESSLNKNGFVAEPQRIYHISVLDVMEGMAIVEIATPRRFDYLQMYKDGESWKIFHSLVKNNPGYSFNSNLVPAIGQKMPDFTLPVYQGGDFVLSKLTGKNVVVVFPRGWIGDHWCQVCQYQYTELAELLKSKNLLKKYNLEVVFIMPYSKERITDWANKLPEGLKTIEGWKDARNAGKEFSEYITLNYPNHYDIKSGDLPIPILMDADQKISQKFQLFTGFWDGIRAEQNIPTVFILDKNGKIQFKYHSQTTFDRPGADYLMNIVKGLQ
jgi:peroxiredoxin